MDSKQQFSGKILGSQGACCGRLIDDDRHFFLESMEAAPKKGLNGLTFMFIQHSRKLL